jgi:4-amino-4-deoxy-L-arabinose transferase-like glycosyltransferase
MRGSQFAKCEGVGLVGVLCVALLYHLVGRSFGPEAGLLATLALAITPISVATNLHTIIRIVYVL